MTTPTPDRLTEAERYAVKGILDRPYADPDADAATEPEEGA